MEHTDVDLSIQRAVLGLHTELRQLPSAALVGPTVTPRHLILQRQ